MDNLWWLPDVTRGLLMGGTLLLAFGFRGEMKKMQKEMEALREETAYVKRNSKQLSRHISELEMELINMGRNIHLG